MPLKNDNFVSERDLAMSKNINFYWSFHNYPLGKLALPAKPILTLTLVMGSRADNPGGVAQCIYIKRERERDKEKERERVILVVVAKVLLLVLPDPLRGMGAWRKTMEPLKPGNSTGPGSEIVEIESRQRANGAKSP